MLRQIKISTEMMKRIVTNPLAPHNKNFHHTSKEARKMWKKVKETKYWKSEK